MYISCLALSTLWQDRFWRPGRAHAPICRTSCVLLYILYFIQWQGRTYGPRVAPLPLPPPEQVVMTDNDHGALMKGECHVVALVPRPPPAKLATAGGRYRLLGAIRALTGRSTILCQKALARQSTEYRLQV